MKQRRNSYFLILPVLATIVILFTRYLKGYPEKVERFYAQGIYPYFAQFLSTISSLVPFSLSDTLYFILILFFIILLVMMILRKLRFFKFLKIVLNSVSLLVILFYLFWGFNYYREDFYTRSNLSSNGEITNYEFLSVYEKFIKEINEKHIEIVTIDTIAIDHAIEKSYQNLAEVLNINYPSGKREPKAITCSKFFAKAVITGYYGPFFSEININSHTHPYQYPFVLAHEKAHQFGITSEAEANFISWLVCSNSDNITVQYSSFLSALPYLLNSAYDLKSADTITNKLDKAVLLDMNTYFAHYRALHNKKVDQVASKVNDTYLKANNVEEGIRDYSGITKFILDYYLDEDFQKQIHLAIEQTTHPN